MLKLAKVMKQLSKVAFILMLAFFNAPLLSQDDKPFRVFDNRVKDERGGFSGNKEALSKVFNTERIRLGDKFEAELLTYLGNDIEKHYWISSFLESPSYLHGNNRLPYLALLLKQQGLSLLRGKTDQEGLGDFVRLSVTAAVLSEELGLSVLADVHKKDAEKVLASDPDFSAWVPGMTQYNRCLYGSIGTGRRGLCKKNEVTSNQHRLRCPISGGILDGKAVIKPAPVYPNEAKAQRVSGVVRVPILIDESGRFDSLLPGVSGHPLLQQAAINAATKAQFLPTKLSGP